jgi:hypothetical protein
MEESAAAAKKFGMSTASVKGQEKKQQDNRLSMMLQRQAQVAKAKATRTAMEHHDNRVGASSDWLTHERRNVETIGAIDEVQFEIRVARHRIGENLV